MSAGTRILVLGVELGFGESNTLLGAARALADAGHDVTVAATPRFAARVRAADLRAVEIGRDLEPGEPSYWDTVFETLLDVHRGPRRWLQDAVLPSAEAWIAGCRDLASASHLVVAGSLAPFAPVIAQAAGIPWLRIARAPEGLGPDAPDELRHWLTARIARASEGLPEPARKLAARAQHAWQVRTHAGVAPAPALRVAAYSPELAVAQTEGASATVQTGALRHDGPEALDPELARFLGAGPPPVLLTLGSTPSVYRPGAILDAFAEAIGRIAEARGVLLVADPLVDTLRPRFESASLRVAGYTPYGELMPRCRAVVHHGGAGPLARALAAGIPSLIIGHAAYQRAHGALAVARGVARTLPPADLTETSLEATLRALLEDEALQARAREIGARVREEEPEAALVEAVGACLERAPRPVASQSSALGAATTSRPVRSRISL